MAGSNRTQYRRWTEAETLWLQELAGDLPFHLVMSQFNHWAGKQGLPHRSPDSVRKKLRHLGTSRVPVGAWIRLGDVAQMLGKDRSTIRLWSTSGLLRYHRAGRYSSVNRDDLIRLARNRPRLFAGCDRSGLLLLLEDEALVTGILQRFPRRYSAAGRGRRVRWVDTGQVFPTYREASAAAHICRQAISAALRDGRTVAGMRFERAD